MLIRIVFILICAVAASASANAQNDRDGRDELAPDLFRTSDRCIACHSNLRAASGEDVSIGYSWRASMMANAARDPYWHAAVRREVTDHPAAQAAIEDKCSTCHMPMARFAAAAAGGTGQVFANLYTVSGAENHFATDGVSCTVCHQILSDNFGQPGSFEGGFALDASASGVRTLFGPHDVDDGRTALMQSAAQFAPSASSHLQQSELCATCHTLFTNALNAAGEEIGELAEQVPYLEWLHSEFRETQSCQSCHMPELAEDTPITSVLGEPRPGFSQHVFRGGNAFMLSILNKHRGELGVMALPQELDRSIRRTKDYLGSQTAQLSVEAIRRSRSLLEFEVVVRSLAGHKLPTAYPSRRVWLHVTVSDAMGNTVFESGALEADGSITGNDNDADAARYEPHYSRIERDDQVQIYEPVMVDQAGRVTTGLLHGVRYIKDNRILPRGFDKATAPRDVAVYGAASGDADFTGGGDRVDYRLDLGTSEGPLNIDVELQYQSIGYRWAANLRSYDAAETIRFVSYYEESAGDSAVRIASVSAEAPAP